MDAIFDSARAASTLQLPPEICADVAAFKKLQGVEQEDETFQIFSTELIYGEITAAGMTSLFECLGKHLTNRTDGDGSHVPGRLFADVGSGNGFPAMAAACRAAHPTFDQVVGIELQPRYHRNAIRNALLVNASNSASLVPEAHAAETPGTSTSLPTLTYICGDFLDLRACATQIAPWDCYNSAHALGAWSGLLSSEHFELWHSGYGADDATITRETGALPRFGLVRMWCFVMARGLTTASLMES
jgi:hypothetical protein